MTGGKPIHFYVIKPDGILTDVNDMLTDDMLRRLVGGDFEVIHPQDRELVMFTNENGKELGLNPNWLATSLVRTRLRPGDFVVGTVVVTGKPDEDGDVRSLSANVIAAIKQLKEDR